MSGYYLNWSSNNWDTDSWVESAKFDSIESIITTMKNCFYNGEWVTDRFNNEVDVDLKNICLKRGNYYE